VIFNSPTRQPGMSSNRYSIVPEGLGEHIGRDHVRIAEGIRAVAEGVEVDARHLRRWSMDARAVEVLARTLLHRGTDGRIVFNGSGAYVQLDAQRSLLERDDRGAAQLIDFLGPLEEWLQRFSAAVSARSDTPPCDDAHLEALFGVGFEILHEAILTIAFAS
jgi:hypothetical protein